MGEQIFTVIGKEIDTTLFGYIGMVISRVLTFVGPIALALITVWVLITAINIMLGKSQDPVLEFLGKASFLYFIVGTATVGSIYHYAVVDMHAGLTTSVVTLFAPKGSALANVGSIWSALDLFNNRASDLVGEALTNGLLDNFSPIAAIFCAVLFALGDCIFLTVALGVTLFAKTISSFLLGVGPIFILTLLFQATKQFFWNWLGALLGSVVLTWVVFFILGFTLHLNEKMVSTVSANLGGLNILAQSLVFLVFCAGFAIFTWQAPSFASGLTGGSATQMGAQMMLTLYSLLKKNKQPPQPTPNGGAGAGSGGSVKPNGAYNAGHTLGSAMGLHHAFQRIAAAGGRP